MTKHHLRMEIGQVLIKCKKKLQEYLQPFKMMHRGPQSSPF